MIFDQPYILKQIPALIILIPMFLAVLNILFSSNFIARIFFFISNILVFFVASYGLANIDTSIFYVFGGWQSPYGIELKYDYFSGYLCFVVSLVFWIFSIAILGSFKDIDKYISINRDHIPYSLMMLIQSAFYGMILTNDIFNLYVFLEIASLSSYPLLTVGDNKRRYIYAFEYLMIGTLSATIILVSIGLVFAQVGSLNLNSINKFISNADPSLILLTFSMLILGVCTKLAVFPLHSWKINSYHSVSKIINAFFFISSPIIFISVLFKFRAIFLKSSDIDLILNILGCITLVAGSYMAFKQNNYIKIILLSSIASIGYYLVLLPASTENAIFIILQLILVDSLVKLSLALVPIAFSANNYEISFLNNFIKKSKALSALLILIFLNAASLPPSIYFFNKVRIITFLAESNFIFIAPVAIGSLLIAMYYVRLIRRVIKIDQSSAEIVIDNFALSSLILLVVILTYITFQTGYFDMIARLTFVGL